MKKIFFVLSVLLLSPGAHAAAATCNLIASMHTAARFAGKSISVIIDNAVTQSCGSVPAWFHADVRFVEVLD